MDKEIVIKFDKDAHKEYEELQELVTQGTIAKKKPTYSQLLSSINTALKNIKANSHYGDLIPRKYISRVELVGYWRLLYTLIGDEVSIIAFILEFMDHKKYDKVFGYRKK